MSKSNVLASNPLEMLVGGGEPAESPRKRSRAVRRASAAVARPDVEPPSSVPVAEKPAVEPLTVEPLPVKEVPRAANSVAKPDASVKAPPARSPAPPAAAAPVESVARAPSSDMPSATPSAGSVLPLLRGNRIGTLHQPYERRDGVRTRQGSFSLPVDLLDKVSHRAVELRMKKSELVQRALEAYFDSRAG